MLEKIFGPTVKFDKAIGQGTVKFSRKNKVEIKLINSALESYASCNAKKVHDEFVLLSNGENLAKIDMYRPITYGKNTVYQGSIFMDPPNAFPFASLASMGKKLAKILNKP